MNRTAFLKALKKHGVVFFRNGANHDLYIHSKTGKKIPIPRHNEFSNDFFKAILKEIPK
jgi:predicted RNA binding protein YcfA (HicA-like mRNA interferase family)